MINPEEAVLLLIGHGSRQPHNKDVVEGLGDIIRQSGMWKSVECCFLEHSSPTIPEGLSNACGDGATTIVCVPVLIAAGAHLSRDIPLELGIDAGEKKAKRMMQGVMRTILLADAIGADAGLADILDRKGRVMLQ